MNRFLLIFCTIFVLFEHLSCSLKHKTKPPIDYCSFVFAEGQGYVFNIAPEDYLSSIEIKMKKNGFDLINNKDSLRKIYMLDTLGMKVLIESSFLPDLYLKELKASIVILEDSEAALQLYDCLSAHYYRIHGSGKKEKGAYTWKFSDWEQLRIMHTQAKVLGFIPHRTRPILIYYENQKGATCGQ